MDSDPADLVVRIRNGDATAEVELIERFHRGTRLMLRRLVGDPSLVDDLLQETFALVIAKARAGEIHVPDRLAGFIRSTARNLLIADRRKEARYATVENPDVMEALARTGPAPAAEAPGDRSQLAQVIRNEEAKTVRQLLGELRHERDRELLLRFYLSEDDKDRLCADLGIDPGHFRRVLFRARQRLKALWQRRENRAWIGAPQAG